MHLAFIVDPLTVLKPAKDSSIAMMRSAARRGHDVFAIESSSVGWYVYDSHGKNLVCGEAIQLSLASNTQHEANGALNRESWYKEAGRQKMPLSEFDAVLMRKDPPCNIDYVSLTWLLSQAEKEGAKVFNHPQALRDHSEKMATSEFVQFCPPSIFSRSIKALNDFIDNLQDIVIKPLDGMGGTEVFRLTPGDPNRNAILESVTRYEKRIVMAQKYVPQINDGDKRVFIVNGEVMPWCLARLPKNGETRANLATGGTGVARPLVERDLQIAQALAPQLVARGLLLVGLDIIGDYLSEINVTSPTCMVEIAEQSGFDIAERVITAVEEVIQV